MYEAIFMGATGLINQQRRMDTAADNLANVNTVGFKAARYDFKDALYTAGLVPGPPYTPDGSQQKGHGVMMAAVSRTFETGSLFQTGNELDLAIEGDGFFEVSDVYGRLLYTKGGNFYKSDGAEGCFIVNSQGYFVQDDSGSRIAVPEGTTNIQVAEDGTVTFYNDVTPLESVKLAIYSFPNKFGLDYAGGNNHAEGVSSGGRMEPGDFVVKQGYLESSTVNMSQEMTVMIRAQRALSLAARAVTTADEMEGLANNMKR